MVREKETQIGTSGYLQGFTLTQNSSWGCLPCSTPPT